SQLQPANELLLQGGMRFRQVEGRWLAERSVAGLAAAGAAAGTLPLRAQQHEGWLRGVEAARALGYPQPDAGDYPAAESTGPTSSVAMPFSCLCPQANPRDRKRFVCLCEDVTEKDLQQAIAEG